MTTAGRLANRILRRAGLEVSRAQDMPPDFDPELRAIVREVRPFSMTSPERLAAVVEAVRYVDRYGLSGAIVECGVWRGGSTMAAARAHQASGIARRELFLYDTFEGLPPPSDIDVDLTGRSANSRLAREDPVAGDFWCVAELDVVRRNIASVGYPSELVTYVPGLVEETIPATVPDEIAVLRLDTDWYESTRHELEHLTPRVVPGGVLIVDDYGHWQGARRAVDDWVAANSRPILLNRTDYTGRIAVLP